MKKTYYIIYKVATALLLLFALGLTALPASGQNRGRQYDADHPLTIIGDWDKPPYEFLNDQGVPAGTNIDLMKRIAKEMGIPCRFILKEWSSAMKAFERGDADLILANVRRYRSSAYHSTQNIINYDRICAATLADTTGHTVSNKELISGGLVLKPGDYTSMFFRDVTPEEAANIEYQSPKVALQGVIAGDYKYFVWGEEPLKRKIKELNLEGLELKDVSLPVSEIHIIGHDKDLIYEIDDIYSRLKQSGEVQRINDQWLHPERIKKTWNFWPFVYIFIGLMLLTAIFYGMTRMARKHLRHATRNSRDLYDMMYKALHMGNFHIVEYDIKRDLFTNSYGMPILPSKGISLKEFTEHIHPHEAQEFTQKMNMLLSGRERKFELRKRWKAFGEDDRWLNLEGHAIVELDADGQPAFVINAVNDLTKNMEDDRDTREMEQLFHTLSNLPFVAQSFYDKDGWLISLNDAMKQLCGISSENPETERYWKSLNLFDTPQFHGIFTPEDREDILMCQHMKYPEINVDRYIEFQIHPLFSATGDIYSYFVSAIDISDVRQRHLKVNRLKREIQQTTARNELHEQWLKFLTRQGNTFLWHSDVRQQTAYFYRSLEAKEKDEYVELPFATHISYMPESERTQAMELYNNPKPYDSIQHFTNTIFDTGESWYHMTGQPMFDDQGNFIGHRGYSLDITRKMSLKSRQAEKEMLVNDSARLKSSFMASMTHELRTPLNSIVGFTDVLRVVDDSTERGEYLRIIRNNCDMLQRLISDILVASSLHDGPTSIEPADIEFSKAFDDLCLTMQQRVEEAGLEFQKDNPYETFYTTLDMDRIVQVVTNFVTNAVKFTKQGHIKVGYTYTQHGLHIYCEDTGAGIPKDKQEVIFERFVKLDEFVQGTGMGLNICKSIAERCGGKIGVISEGPDTGSTFWIWIPCERKLSPVTSTSNQ